MASDSFSINTPDHFNFGECLWFLDRDLDDVMHKVFPGSVRKLVAVDGEHALIEISEKNKKLRVRYLTGTIRNNKAIAAFLNEWFDLDRDIAPFYRLLRKDPDFAFMVREFRGLHIVGIPDFFEVLCWCVIGQQINLTFAYKIKRRLVEQYGRSVFYEGQTYYIFPDPEVIAGITAGELKKLQMTGKKAEYLIGIARHYLDGSLSKENIAALDNENSMIAELTKIRGIGEWTANYAIMKGLRAMNGVPYGDSGVNQALLNLKGIPKKNNRAEVDAVFSRFNGWKTYLVFYLWRSLRQPVSVQAGSVTLSGRRPRRL